MKENIIKNSIKFVDYLANEETTVLMMKLIVLKNVYIIPLLNK